MKVMKPRREGDAWRPIHSELAARLEQGACPEVLLNTVLTAFSSRRHEALRLLGDIEDPNLRGICGRFVIYSRMAPIPFANDRDIQESILKLSLVDQLALFASLDDQEQFDQALSDIESHLESA